MSDEFWVKSCEATARACPLSCQMSTPTIMLSMGRTSSHVRRLSMRFQQVTQHAIRFASHHCSIPCRSKAGDLVPSHGQDVFKSHSCGLGCTTESQDTTPPGFCDTCSSGAA